MANDYITIINGATGEEITREMTDAEQAARNAEIKEYQERKAKIVAEIEEKESAKNALLEKLGISQDEAKLLLS